MCNLAVLVALQVQVSEVGARTLKVSGEVEDERKKEEEGKNRRKTRGEEEHAFSQQIKEEDDEEKEEDIFSLGKVPVFSKKPSRSLWKEPVTRYSSRFLHRDGLGGLREVGANQVKYASREFLPVLSGQSA